MRGFIVHVGEVSSIFTFSSRFAKNTPIIFCLFGESVAGDKYAAYFWALTFFWPNWLKKTKFK